MRNDDGTLTGIISILSSQVSYIGMTADNQKDQGLRMKIERSWTPGNGPDGPRDLAHGSRQAAVGNAH